MSFLFKPILPNRLFNFLLFFGFVSFHEPMACAQFYRDFSVHYAETNTVGTTVTQNHKLLQNVAEDNDHDETGTENYSRPGFIFRYGQYFLIQIPKVHGSVHFGLSLCGGLQTYKNGFHDSGYNHQYNIDNGNGKNNPKLAGIVMAQNNYVNLGPEFNIAIGSEENPYSGIMLGLGFGYLKNFLIGTPNKYFLKTDGLHNEILNLHSNFNKTFNSQFISFSIKFMFEVFSFSLSLRNEWSGNMMHAEYSRMQNGNILSTDYFKDKINYDVAMIGVGCNFANLYLMQHTQKHGSFTGLHNINIKGEIAVEKTNSDATKSLIQVLKKDTTGLKESGIIHKIYDVINIKDSSVEIGVWDYDKTDGDSIAIFLNGKKYNSNIAITSTVKKIHFPLNKGANHILILFISEGKMKPGTLEMSVSYGKKKSTRYLLNSGRHNAVQIQINRK